MPELAGVTQEFTPPLSLKNKPKEKQCPKCARGTMGSVKSSYSAQPSNGSGMAPMRSAIVVSFRCLRPSAV